MALQSDTIFNLNDTLAKGPELVSSGSPTDSSSIIVADSIAPITAKNPTPPTRFVTSSQYPTKTIQPKLIPQNTDVWLLGILIACLFMLAIIRFTGKKALQNIFEAWRTLKPVMQHQKFNEAPTTVFNVILFLLKVIVYSVFVVILVKKFKLLPPGHDLFSIQQFIIIAAIIGGLLIVQFTLARLTGFIFDAGEMTKKYIANSFTLNVISAVTILPFLMISLYDNSLASIYAAIGIFALLFIFRTIKGTFITMSERKYLLYHFFIYFCTLEILPVFIIIKAISGVNIL